MVEHSELAYRMMTRHYGAELVYTQMFNCNSFLSSKDFRELCFTTTEADRPLIVQFAGHDPQALLAAAKLVCYKKKENISSLNILKIGMLFFFVFSIVLFIIFEL